MTTYLKQVKIILQTRAGFSVGSGAGLYWVFILFSISSLSSYLIVNVNPEVVLVLPLLTSFSLSLQHIGNYLLSFTLIRKTLSAYILWIFYIRSYFIKENPNVLYAVALLLLLFKVIYPDSITYTNSMFVWAYLGVNLITYDSIGSALADVIFNNKASALSKLILPLLTVSTPSSNMILRHTHMRAIIGAVIGKTYMSSTGRASIGIAVISGSGYLFNEHLNRSHESVENTSNRASAERVAQLNCESAERTAQLNRESAEHIAQLNRESAERIAASNKGWRWWK